MEKILLVEDDPITLKILASTLEKYNYSSIKAKDGAEALSCLNEDSIIISAVILDLNLPDVNGREILKFIRNHHRYSSIAVIIVTENSDKIDTVVSLEMGADDYITKPFHHRELIARLNTILRRTRLPEEVPGSVLVFDDLKIDMEKRIVRRNNDIVNLSFKEFEILSLLAKNPGKVISRDTILDEIGGREYILETRSVDMHISSIRKKLQDTGKVKKYIDTVSGVGYRFRDQKK